MDPLWGILISAIGLFMLVCSLLETDFIVYKLLIYRSKKLWGKNVHRFYTVLGAVIIVLGILAAIGIIW